MKWIAALLMIVNVMIYLSVGGRSETDAPVASLLKPDVNKEGMLLLSEVSETQRASSVSPKPKSIEVEILEEELGISTASVNENALQLPSNVTGEETPGNPLLCYRVGPFKEKSNWEAATQWMQERDFSFEQAVSQSRELKAVRVYIGPFTGADATKLTVKELKTKKLDHFVYVADNGETRVSLGYFTQEELADKFIDYLGSVDIQARSVSEYRTLGPYNWIEAKMAGERADSLLTQSWLVKGVSVAQVDC